MSVDATRWAWKAPVSSSLDRLLLLALADRAGEDHTAWPSYERLAQDTNLDPKTIPVALDRLQKAGLIVDTGERKGPTKRVKVWRLIGVDCRMESQQAHPKTGALNHTKNGVINPSENGGIKPIQKREDLEGNDPKNGCLNDPKNGWMNPPKNGCLNDPVFGVQNLKENLSMNLKKNQGEKSENFWEEQEQGQQVRIGLAGIELSLFNQARRIHIGLTQGQVIDMAQQTGREVFDVLNGLLAMEPS